MASPLVVPRKVEGDEEAAAEGHVTGWWSHVRWIVGLMLLPCRPIVSFASVPRTSGGGGGGGVSAVTGTLLFPLSKRDKVGLILQEGGPAGPTLAVLDLPVPAGATDFFGLGRIILECDRARAGEGPLLSAPSWAVHCEGRRVGFAGRRAAPTEAEEWALQATLAVSAGAGKLPGAHEGGGPGGGFTYFRGRFDRVVGSADSETFHLVQPAGWLGHDFSLFFLRV